MCSKNYCAINSDGVKFVRNTVCNYNAVSSSSTYRYCASHQEIPGHAVRSKCLKI